MGTGRQTARRLALALCVTLTGVALGACGSSSSGSKPPDYHAALAGAPKPLAAVYAKAGQLLPGGTAAFQRQLDALRGHPVVVNQWASWCGPCRIEFPFFQKVSASIGTRVAFLGVDANDNASAAKTFLREEPVPYPSFTDPNYDIARGTLANQIGNPATAFFDASGKRVYTHIGQYASEADLLADIHRYALGE